MEKYREAVFRKLNKWEAIIIMVYSLICFALARYAQENILGVFAFMTSLFFSLKKRSVALSAAIVVSPLFAQFSNGFFLILVYVPFLLFSLLYIISRRIEIKPFRIYLWCVLLVFVSYTFGYDPNDVILLLQIFSMTIFYTIYTSFNKSDVPIVIMGYICSAVIVCGLILSSDLTSFTSLGRLSFGDNIKTLSFACAIPMSFILYSFLGKKNLFSNMANGFYKIIEGVLLILFLLIILMTLARGVILSLVAGSVILLILSQKSIKVFLFFILISGLAVYVYFFLESLDLFRMDRIMAFDEYASGNGRTEIWEHYLKRIYEMGIHSVFWGTGPGDISRISHMDAYAHSTILDYYFSYGLVGFLTFLIIEFCILNKLFRYNSNIPFIIVITCVIAYSTHGSAANMTFFIIQAIMMVNLK